MNLVHVSSLEPGQVVAEAVTGPSGALLCPAGSRLTASAIAHLVGAGIETVVVEREDGELEEKQRLLTKERIEALHARFEGVEDVLLLRIESTAETCLRRLYPACEEPS